MIFDIGTYCCYTLLFVTGPWTKDDNGAFFKAALLSGPPGVGKLNIRNYLNLI